MKKKKNILHKLYLTQNQKTKKQKKNTKKIILHKPIKNAKKKILYYTNP